MQQGYLENKRPEFNTFQVVFINDAYGIYDLRMDLGSKPSEELCGQVTSLVG